MSATTAAPARSSDVTIQLRPLPATLRFYTLYFAAGLYLSLVFWLLISSLRITHGHFVYALDDAYIHMAIAKNLAAHGVFGVTSHEFTSASSSILWPFLLAAFYKIFGPVVIIPFLLQLAIGIALLWLSLDTLKNAGVTSNWYAIFALAALVVATPMPAMTFVAMEHLLHVLATILFATVSLGYLYHARPGFVAVLLSAAFLCSVRYEGAFLVASVALLFLLEKKIFQSVFVGLAGASPILLFGLYSIAHGAYFLPNSLLLKKRAIDTDTLLRIFSLRSDSPEIFSLVLAALLMLCFGARTPFSRGLLKLFLLAALFHQSFASYGWFYRYEAYLVALGLIAVAVSAHRFFAKPARLVWISAVLVLLVLAPPLFRRATQSAAQTPHAIADIYYQQFQMAGFFRDYYPSGRIAINDIGAICFYSDPHMLDLVGLASMDITRLRIENQLWMPGAARRVLLARHQKNDGQDIEVAAVFDSWFGIDRAGPPPGWIKAGVWEMPGDPIFGGHYVSFYGNGSDNAAQLRANLAAFHKTLPPELQQLATP